MWDAVGIEAFAGSSTSSEKDQSIQKISDVNDLPPVARSTYNLVRFFLLRSGTAKSKCSPFDTVLVVVFLFDVV